MGDNEVVPSRDLNRNYIIFDVLFLVTFSVVLLITKRRLTFIFSIIGGIVYFLVDWGIFYKALSTRVVKGANPAAFLFWLSMSYGMTNFAWIWLLLRREKEKRKLELSFIIIVAWISIPLITDITGKKIDIQISRGTSKYHGVMAILLFIGYMIVIVHNMIREDKYRISIPWLMFTGILVQFAWEAILLIYGIRKSGYGPLIVDSLLETNLGVPFIFFIQKFVLSYINEDLTMVKAVPITEPAKSVDTPSGINSQELLIKESQTPKESISEIELATI